MNLYQECLDFMNKKSDDVNKISGCYSLGKLKVNGWEVIISVSALKEDNTDDNRDIVVTPMLVVPRYLNGQRTDTPKEKLELNSNAEYIFWQAEGRNKAMFDKVECKLDNDKEISDLDLVEKTGGQNSINDSIFYWLREYSDLLGYDFQAILDELKNDFAIETDF